MPADYTRWRITRATDQAQWSWLNQAIKLQVQITDPSLYGCTFALARVRVYSSNADQLRSDNWQKLSLSIVELKPILRLPQRLRTDFGWDYLREFPTDAASGLSAVQIWRNLGFNTIPALVSQSPEFSHCDLSAKMGYYHVLPCRADPITFLTLAGQGGNIQIPASSSRLRSVLQTGLGRVCGMSCICRPSRRMALRPFLTGWVASRYDKRLLVSLDH